MNWLDSSCKFSDLNLVFEIHQYLVKEENELKYGVPFLHNQVEKDKKGRSYIISDLSRRKDKKFYLNHYPKKKLLSTVALRRKRAFNVPLCRTNRLMNSFIMHNAAIF